MSSVQHLREFISARLTAAAEEIFSEFEKSIVQYEEEIDRQRKTLDIMWKTRVNLQTTDVPQQDACKEADSPAEQQLCDQERTSSLNQEEAEPPQIKEELEELCSSQEGEQLDLKQETDAFIATHKYQDISEAETNTGKLFCHNSLFSKKESLSKKDGNHMEMGSTSDAGVQPKQRHDENRKNCNNFSISSVSESQLDSESVKPSVKCDVCGKAFRDRCSMEQHHVVHTGLKPYVCKTCGKCFSHNRTLLNHLRIHTGEKLFPCKTCGKSFTRKTDLLTHMRIHSGEKPFSCGTCGKRFSQRSNLMVHTVIHSGERPFSCKICGKTFNQKSYLGVHMRIHTGEVYSCEICGKGFHFKQSLTAHMRTHTGEKLSSLETIEKF